MRGWTLPHYNKEKFSKCATQVDDRNFIIDKIRVAKYGRALNKVQFDSERLVHVRQSAAI